MIIQHLPKLNDFIKGIITEIIFSIPFMLLIIIDDFIFAVLSFFSPIFVLLVIVFFVISGLLSLIYKKTNVFKFISGLCLSLSLIMVLYKK